MDTNPIYEQIIDQLAAQDYAIVDNFISAETTAHLRQSSEYKFAQRLFKQAGVGNASKFQLNADIRRDKILWLDPQSEHLTTAERFFCNQIDNFIQYLNQTCFLGLKSYELHYARYEKGEYYQRHLDQFQQNGSRKLSLICYLNPTWQPSDGGELRIELPNDKIADISPLAGRLVIFWADKIWHQVLPTQQLRHSLTGWLKV